MDKDKVRKLAQEHWGYIAGILRTHKEREDIIEIIGDHYRTSFIHGFKHGIQECKNDIRN